MGFRGTEAREGVGGGTWWRTEREISADEIEAIISHPEFADVSRSSGLPVAFGHLMDGRFVIVVYRWVDQVTVQPMSAYEVPE